MENREQLSRFVPEKAREYAAVGVLALSLFSLSACGPEKTDAHTSYGDGEPQVTIVPTPTTAHSWKEDCRTSVVVEAGDSVSSTILEKAQNECPHITFEDVKESFYQMNRNLNEVYTGETLNLTDFTQEK